MPSEMPAEGGIVPFLDDAASEVGHLENAQPTMICFTLPASKEQDAANEERASGRASGL